MTKPTRTQDAIDLIERLKDAGFAVSAEINSNNNPLSIGQNSARIGIYMRLPTALNTLEQFDRPSHRWDMPDCFGPLLQVLLFEIQMGVVSDVVNARKLLTVLGGDTITAWIPALILAALGFPEYELAASNDDIDDLLNGSE